MAAVSGPIRKLFLKHKIHKHLGIALLHRHFSIQPKARLVDCRNISTPWDMGNDTASVIRKYDGLVLPRSFRLIGGSFVPYEFEFFDTEPPHQMNQAFMSQLSDQLCQLGLADILGLRNLDEYDSGLTVEITEGNANIMIKRGIVPEEELIPALWVFDEDGDQACHCREFCRTKGGNHVESNHACS